MPLALCNARIVTLRPDAPGARRGAALRDLGVIPLGHAIIDDGGVLQALAPGAAPRGITTIDLAGRTILPGWVDCHTHACWSGDRSAEWARKLAGVPYLEILAAGGGILSTVRSVRASDRASLAAHLTRRLERMRALGTVAAEVKTGYGLSTVAELTMLRAVLDARGALPGMPIVPTFLGAHALDPNNPQWPDECISQALPEACALAPHITVDLFCEKGAWSVEQSLMLLDAALARGCPIRAHTDQFTSTGLVPHLVERGAISIDHLEASTDEHLRLIAESTTIGVGLPASPFSLSTPFMRGRDFIDMGGAIAIASNWNPGSAPTPSVAFAAALAVRFMGLTPEEAITAATWNAACVLGLSDTVGALHVGQPARLQVVDAPDERAAVLELAAGAPALVITPPGVTGSDSGLVAAAASALSD